MNNMTATFLQDTSAEYESNGVRKQMQKIKKSILYSHTLTTTVMTLIKHI